MRHTGPLLLLLAALLATGCGSRDPRFRDDTIYVGGFHKKTSPNRASFDNVSYWDGDRTDGAPAIRISLSE